jgi:hypothetical protein
VSGNYRRHAIHGLAAPSNIPLMPLTCSHLSHSRADVRASGRGLGYGEPVASAQQWVAAVRLADGSLRYLCPSGTRRGGQDDWSPRANQALRFPSKADAEKVADGFEVNATPKEYLALRL